MEEIFRLCNVNIILVIVSIFLIFCEAIISIDCERFFLIPLICTIIHVFMFFELLYSIDSHASACQNIFIAHKYNCQFTNYTPINIISFISGIVLILHFIYYWNKINEKV